MRTVFLPRRGLLAALAFLVLLGGITAYCQIRSKTGRACLHQRSAHLPGKQRAKSSGHHHKRGLGGGIYSGYAGGVK